MVGLVVGLGLACALWGHPGRSEPKRYDPDPQSCQAEGIRKAFLANLLPWRDQPTVVRERLRQLQAAMTLDTLRECQAKGLLSHEQVEALTAELALKTPSLSTTVAPGPSQAPTRP